MLTHVVCFKFQNAESSAEVKELLLSMRDRIPALKGIEAGENITASERSFDLALITRHEDAAGLAAYQAHPVHQKVLEELGPLLATAVAVDFVG